MFEGLYIPCGLGTPSGFARRSWRELLQRVWVLLMPLLPNLVNGWMADISEEFYQTMTSPCATVVRLS